MNRTAPRRPSVEPLRARALVIWMCLAPIMSTVLVLAIVLRPDRAASLETDPPGAAEPVPKAPAEADR